MAPDKGCGSVYFQVNSHRDENNLSCSKKRRWIYASLLPQCALHWLVALIPSVNYNNPIARQETASRTFRALVAHVACTQRSAVFGRVDLHRLHCPASDRWRASRCPQPIQAMEKSYGVCICTWVNSKAEQIANATKSCGRWWQIAQPPSLKSEKQDRL